MFINGPSNPLTTQSSWPGISTREQVKYELKKRNPSPKKNRTQEISIFAAMRQGTWLKIVQSCLPKEEMGKANTMAKARKKGKVDGNCEEEETDK
jgi:hypothetical protein